MLVSLRSGDQYVRPVQLTSAARINRLAATRFASSPCQLRGGRYDKHFGKRNCAMKEIPSHGHAMRHLREETR